MNAGAITKLLRARHKLEDGWIVLEELRRGGRQDQRVDVLAVGTWQTKNHLIAYEVKVDRSDWRRELNDPSKREPWASVVNEFCFVAPKGVIPLEEVPEGFGLLEVVGTGTIRAARRARQAKREVPSEVWRVILNRLRDQQREREVEASRNEWVKIAGRQIDFETLKRLGHKEWEWRGERMTEYEMRARVRDEVKQLRAKGEKWDPIVRAAIAQYRKSKDLGYFDKFTPDDVAAWLRSIEAYQSVAELAKRLKTIAANINAHAVAMEDRA